MWVTTVLLYILIEVKKVLSLWNVKKNYSNSCRQKVSQHIDNCADLSLDEVFAKQKAVDYLKDLKQYLKNTEVVNFGIINANLEGRGKMYIENLQRKAKVIKFSDFDSHEKKKKAITFKGTLKRKGKKYALVDVKDDIANMVIG